MRATALAAVAITLVPFAAPLAQSERVVTTHHRMLLDGKPVEYTAQAGRIDIAGAHGGAPHARMFFVAYRLESATAQRPVPVTSGIESTAAQRPVPVTSGIESTAAQRPVPVTYGIESTAAQRPVLFLWNGGPGSPSTTLELQSVGPKRLESGRIIDNEQTILPVADLVFVDAVGTGFSRVNRSAYEHEFYNTLGDVAAFAEFVRRWRRLFHAERAPLFVGGESFGSARAAGVAAALLKEHVKVSGVALISGSLAIRRTLPPAIADALHVPEYAVIALHHGKGPSDVGADPTTVRSAARAWALGTYAPALARVATLSPAERDSLAAALARFTGLPDTSIDHRTLVVTPRQFRAELLHDRGERLALFDMRRTTPITESAEDSVAIERFLRDSLRYRTMLRYAGLGGSASDVNERWDYFAPGTTPEQRAAQIAEAVRVGDGPPGVAPAWTEEALSLEPTLRVLVAKGLYDDGSCLATEEAIRRLAEPLRSAFTFRCYDAGHMMYLDAGARAQFSADLWALITGPAAPSRAPRPWTAPRRHRGSKRGGKCNGIEPRRTEARFGGARESHMIAHWDRAGGHGERPRPRW